MQPAKLQIAKPQKIAKPPIAPPKCERCGAKMQLARRVPATAFGPDAEFRTFECPKCHNTNITPYLGAAQRTGTATTFKLS